VSVKALNAARELGRSVDMPAETRLVLWALADYANNAGECWPGWRRISNDCNIGNEEKDGGARQVGRCIERLIALKLLVRIVRRRADGTKLKNAYRLILPGLDEPEEGGMTTGHQCPLVNRTPLSSSQQDTLVPLSTGQKGGLASGHPCPVHIDELTDEPRATTASLVFPTSTDTGKGKTKTGEAELHTASKEEAKQQSSTETTEPKSNDAIALANALFGRGAGSQTAREWLPLIYKLVAQKHAGILPIAWPQVLMLASETRQDFIDGKVRKIGPTFSGLMDAAFKRAGEEKRISDEDRAAREKAEAVV